MKWCGPLMGAIVYISHSSYLPHASNMTMTTSLEPIRPNNFDKTAQSQHPQYLWFGDSDSRVPAEETTGLTPVEMSIYRNVAKIVVSNGIIAFSAVRYDVEHLLW
ncbi:putative carbonic anhydrase [Plasmopara halstedii]